MDDEVDTGMRSRLRALGRRPALLVLAMLLPCDLAFLVLHALHAFTGSPDHWAFDLGADRSYGEILLYLKWVWIAVLCLVAWRTRRAPVLAAIAAVCVALLLEDGLLVHEHIGWALEPAVAGAVPSLAGRPLVAMQIAELAWFCVLLAAIVATFIVGWIRSTREARRDAAAIAVFFIAFAFCAVVVDSAHALVDHGSAADGILTLLEDGGELLAMTPAVSLAFVWAIGEEPGRASVRAAAPERTPSEHALAG